MELSDKINSLINNNDLEGAIVELDKIIEGDSGDADAYFERGKLHWRLGRHREAINDYNRAVSLDSSSPAAEALRQSMEIMAFYNRDLYNP
ncbi:MAG: tetratricopeptide repeat protein [Bacteroides sp.]|nr:tetratricopeptide repeat protein [Bacteroides sp.]MCM1388889.1 tetratricopeptide repeat protein [Bacteroides sp.]